MTSTDFTLLYNPDWGYHRCSTKAYFKSVPNPTNFQYGYYGIENSSIKGSFHLRYPTDSPLYTNKVELVFEGKQFVSWKETDDGNSVSKEKILCKQIKTIWKSTNDQYEEIFTLDLPFEFSLQDNLPATISPLNVKSYGEKIAGGIAGDGSEIGYVTYNLRAQISRPINIFKLQIGQKKVVDIWCRIHKWNSPSSLEDILMKCNQPFEWTDFKDDIGYEIKLEKTLFNYKDIINIPMKFFINDVKKVRIQKICVKIKECHKFKVNNKSKKIGGFVIANSALGGQVKKLTTTSSENNDDNNNEHYFIKMQLNLTRNNLGRKLNCSTSTEMIDIWHKLKIRIYLENSNDILDLLPPIDLEKEIVILNFATKQNSPLIQRPSLMNTWFYHHDENLAENMIKTLSWFGGMKDEDKNSVKATFRKKRYTLIGGNNTR